MACRGDGGNGSLTKGIEGSERPDSPHKTGHCKEEECTEQHMKRILNLNEHRLRWLPKKNDGRENCAGRDCIRCRVVVGWYGEREPSTK